ncbi:MAG: hypothetical protein ACI9EW_001281 [Cellvibrionaceae bacterium]|jgi:hypothetical protein
MNTIIPWISGGLILLLTLGVWQTLKFWRESKKSPYYFLRRQAEQKMQTYSMGTVATAVMLLFFVSYAWQPVADNSLRMVEIHSAKPSSLNASQTIEPSITLAETPESLTVELDKIPEIISLEGDSAVELSANLLSLQSAFDNQTFSSLDRLDSIQAEGAIALESVVEAPELPAEFNQVTPEAPLQDNTEITALEFSDSVDTVSYKPVAPSRLYNEGFYTVYATFDYTNMQDGMVWSWVWRRDGRVVGGGNETWSYGDDGPGYVYLAPPEGFDTGEYSVDIWINGDLQTSANMFVTDDLAATSQ